MIDGFDLALRGKRLAAFWYAELTGPLRDRVSDYAIGYRPVHPASGKCAYTQLRRQCNWIVTT